jgi:hypothetical protein
VARFKMVEGSVFLVPTSRGDALGVAARVYKGNVMISCFFRPDALEASKSGKLSRELALAVWQMGPLGFTQSGWPVIDMLPGWDRDAWKVTTFKSWPAGFAQPEARSYSDSGIKSLVSRRSIDEAEAASLPEDGLYGHLMIPYMLEQLIEAGAGSSAY